MNELVIFSLIYLVVGMVLYSFCSNTAPAGPLTVLLTLTFFLACWPVIVVFWLVIVLSCLILMVGDAICTRVKDLKEPQVQEVQETQEPKVEEQKEENKRKKKKPSKPKENSAE